MIDGLINCFDFSFGDEITTEIFIIFSLSMISMLSLLACALLIKLHKGHRVKLNLVNKANHVYGMPNVLGFQNNLSLNEMPTGSVRSLLSKAIVYLLVFIMIVTPFIQFLDYLAVW